MLNGELRKRYCILTRAVDCFIRTIGTKTSKNQAACSRPIHGISTRWYDYFWWTSSRNFSHERTSFNWLQHYTCLNSFNSMFREIFMRVCFRSFQFVHGQVYVRIDSLRADGSIWSNEKYCLLFLWFNMFVIRSFFA